MYMHVQDYFAFADSIFWFPAWVTLEPSISRWYVPLKRRILSELRNITTNKTVLFIDTTVKNSNLRTYVKIT
jgi:hypothetical protein